QLLLSVDVLRAMMRSVQRKEPVDMQRVSDLQFDLEQIVARKGVSTAGDTPASAPAGAEPASAAPTPAVAEPASATPTSVSSGKAGWTIAFRALPELLLRGNDPLAIFSSLAELGPLRASADCSALPRLREIDSERCYLSWKLELDS